MPRYPGTAWTQEDRTGYHSRSCCFEGLGEEASEADALFSEVDLEIQGVAAELAAQSLTAIYLLGGGRSTRAGAEQAVRRSFGLLSQLIFLLSQSDIAMCLLGIVLGLKKPFL